MNEIQPQRSPITLTPEEWQSGDVLLDITEQRNIPTWARGDH
ncbi:hypothetical protein [Nonomuraea longicatena]